MKAFDRLISIVILVFVLLAAVMNVYLIADQVKRDSEEGRQYRVEISRLEGNLASGTAVEDLDLSSCDYVTAVVPYEEGEQFYKPASDYELRQIDGDLYRFDYKTKGSPKGTSLVICNCVLAGAFLLSLGVLIFIRSQIIKPLDKLSSVPEELARGNLSTGVMEKKSKFFGKLVWGLDVLRQKVEDDRKRNRELEKEEKTLLLSLSHDIKTPLSAIKLSAKALSSGLYDDDEDRKREVAEGIGDKVVEIEHYIKDITGAARDDVTIPEVNISEFYLSELLSKIREYYDAKYDVTKTEVAVGEYKDVLIKADFDRAVEVLQNLVENAYKYGTGNRIEISIGREEYCSLVNVKSFGNVVPATELPHIFDSFWRGSNAEGKEGSGLGLYICRRLMGKMGGDIYAGLTGESMIVTAVFPEA
ncbi:MAG: HAMP domain-containing histidine kinase [Clostridiales bacterium]|nr:HAMP domain-containing histidine kinase [Clostridiales bacterium]